jgi:predicted transcriptional regulator
MAKPLVPGEQPTLGQIAGLVPTGSRPNIRDRISSTPSLGRQVVGGMVTGARNDIFAGPIINLIADALPGYGQEDLDELERSIHGKTAAQVAEWIGEFGVMAPQIFATGGLGRMAIGGIMRAAALQGAQRGMITRGVGELGKLAVKATDIGGDVAKALPKLKIERLGEMVGANTAIGGYFGVRAAFNGASPREALEEAALAGVVGGVFEAGVAGIGLMTKYGRKAYLDQNQFREAWKAAPIGPKGETAAQMARTVVGRERQTVDNIRDGIHKLLDVETQIDELVKLPGRRGQMVEALHGRTMTAKEISETLGVTESNARGVLARLKKEGLVRSKAVEVKREGTSLVTRTSEWKTTKKVVANTRTETRVRKPSELKQREQKFFRELVQKGAYAKADLQAARRFEQIPSLVGVTRRKPFSAAGKSASLQQLATKIFRTPESWVGEFGETGAKTFGGLLAADRNIVRDMAVNAGTLQQLRGTVIKSLKISNKEISKGAMLRYASAFERGELKDYLRRNTTLSPMDTAGVYEAFNQLSLYELTWFNKVLKMGGRPAMTEAELTRHIRPTAGNKPRFLTHIGENMDEDDMVKTLTDLFGDTEQAQRAFSQMLHDPLDLDDLVTMGKELGVDGARLASIADVVTPETLTKVNTIRNRLRMQRGPRGKFESRMPKFGAFDMSRTLSGTLESKHMAGLPVIVDPFEAGLRYSNAASRRWHIGRVIGPSGELLDDALDIIRAEGGNSTLARNIFSDYLDNKYYDELMRGFSKFMTSANVVSKMTLGVLANMSQLSNTVMTMGTRNLLTGFRIAAKHENRVELEKMLALNHSMVTNIGRLLGEEGIAVTGFEKAAEWTLRGTLFSAVERINRLVSGATGYATTKDIVVRGALGRLRGNALDKSRRMAVELGFNLDDAIKQTRVLNQHGGINEKATLANLRQFLSGGNSIGRRTLDDAAFLGAQRTQFIPSKMRRPEWWNSPLGRVTFQFKTFALQQGRLLRDGVFGEAAAGNMAPMAYFLSVAPIAGELVGDLKAAVKDKRRTDDPVLRGIENLTYLGGFGLFTDLWQSTLFGDLSGAVLGPSWDITADLFGAAAKGDVSEAAQSAVKWPVFQAAHAFYRAIDHTEDIISNYLDHTGEADRQRRSTTTRGQFISEALRNKANR